MVRMNGSDYSFSRCRRRRGLWFLAVLVAVGSAGHTAHAEAEDAVVEISDAAWTDNVTDTDKTYVTRYGDAVALHAPLYFWTRVNGRAQALERLRMEGKLPIRHEWLKLLGPQWIYDNTGEPLDAISLSIGLENKIAQLQRELQTRHFFDWRTWSKKDHITRGWWRVSVKYANGDDVLCASKPCRYIIQVK